ncbi:antitoxin Xre/MbcA/ParS toxin-binding domain-containing protein [Roseisolibacter sp. H3M3-2]|uniref:antitoxin Xre/MbcA/ParS toxin-binding domain-containing protein n=1 Tax=Roseisolibacter sp. H3M3-2 TaxID=3031323 RepID=UPI0023D9F201|nr:antitoxin Xre/MbcA/ParS toxin-binding domain-containing protein [Roseisolibacter sp. H3M3-2]MDF1501628.1 DUF2384 domain-containing protein [Roseisolibacter sp. H3M3-2]
MDTSFADRPVERLRWLADRAAEAFPDRPAAEAWLHHPRRELAGFTPAQCADIGASASHRAARLLGRAD